MKQKPNRKRDIGFYILILVILLSVVYLLTGPSHSATNDLVYSEVVSLFEAGQVKQITSGEGLLSSLATFTVKPVQLFAILSNNLGKTSSRLHLAL